MCFESKQQDPGQKGQLIQAIWFQKGEKGEVHRLVLKKLYDQLKTKAIC